MSDPHQQHEQYETTFGARTGTERWNWLNFFDGTQSTDRAGIIILAIAEVGKYTPSLFRSRRVPRPPTTTGDGGPQPQGCGLALVVSGAAMAADVRSGDLVEEPATL
ncbi:MAG: hypothetical protein IIB58_07795, partial [Planctomycetes bacterium]|nr:hypothetical protein [Planctomycetota bacterium]